MEALRFRLSGKNAMFKKPDVNSYYYFTYGNIHKVALLGMFGAIVGYVGYGKMAADKKGNIRFGEKNLPDFYQKLKHLKIGIQPLYKNGQISKKVQVFNNSVGYASQEMGGNLIIKEQWLENPKWIIYLLLDDVESRKIADAILHKNCVYQPYLGKNDHFADILEPSIMTATACEKVVKIHNLFIKDSAEFALIDEKEDEDDIAENIFKYEERYPLGLDRETILYHEEQMVFTNLALKSYNGNIWSIDQKCIAFY